MQIELMMGSPAAGKTTFAELEVAKNPMGVRLLNLDKGNPTDEAIVKKIRQPQGFARVIVDMLLTSNDEVEQLVRYIKNSIPKSSVVIHYWLPDEENCIKNDERRTKGILPYSFSKKRKEGSVATIKYCVVDDPRNSTKLNKLCKIIEHSVFEWTPAHEWAFNHLSSKNSYSKIDGFVMRSSSWSLGGEGRNYNGDTFAIYGESPKEFEELDGLLLELWPNISFLEYKQVLKLAKVVEFDVSDYYSNTQSARWEISLVELYDKVKELKTKRSEQTSVSV